MVAAAASLRRPASLTRWFCGLTGSAAPDRPASSAAKQLSQARDVLVAKEAALQHKISQEMERAKTFTRSGTQQAAMQCLRRRKYYENQMNQVATLQLRIDSKVKMVARSSHGNKQMRT